MAGYGNLSGIYMNLNRLDDARAVLEQAKASKLDGLVIRALVFIGVSQGDTAEMDRQVAWAAGRPGEEDAMLSIQSDTEAYFGRLARPGTSPAVRWTRQYVPIPRRRQLCGRLTPLCARLSSAMQPPPNSKSLAPWPGRRDET